jgi:tetratricopeptide (TPR) repeat protein
MNRTARSPAAAVVAAVFLLLFPTCVPVEPEPEPEPPPVVSEPVPETEPSVEKATDEPADAPVDEPAVVPEAPVLTIDEVYRSITLSIQGGDPAAAIAEYQQAELDRPDEPGTRVLLANLYLLAGDTDEARQALESVLEEEPDNTDALYLFSLVAAADDLRDEQRIRLGQVLEIDPSNAPALAALGELQLQDSQLDAAAGSFNTALAADSENVVARVGLANVYLRQKEYEAAEDELSVVIESGPQHSFSYSDRALARALQREFEGAAADLTAAITLDPDFSWHYLDRGRLRARARDLLGMADDALADYIAGLSLRPDYYPAYLPTGVLCYVAGRFSDAAIFFEGAVNSSESRPEWILLAALAHKVAGNEAAAETWLNAKIGELPRESLVYTLARYYLLPANDGYVLNELRLVTDDTLAGQMHFYLGAQLELIGRTETARATLLEAEDTVPEGMVERRLATHHLDAYRSGSR